MSATHPSERAETQFAALTAALFAGLRGAEVALLSVEGEDTHFIRFNQAKVRQAGHVDRQRVTVRLIDGKRHASVRLDLTGHDDARRCLAALAEARALVAGCDPDPYLLYNTEPRSTRRVDHGTLPGPDEIVASVTDDAAGLDLVGIHASGPIWRGLATSLGQVNWHVVERFDAKVAAYLGGDRAVQTGLSGAHWSRPAWQRTLATARVQLDALARPARTIQPGRYRVLLAPQAMEDLLGVMSWGGFSARALRTGSSPLNRLARGEVQLHPSVTFTEDTAGGWAPSFTADGFVRPDRVTLVEAGRHAGELVSARTAGEFSLPANGADSDESPRALAMAPGDIPPDDALARLGTGLAIGNLWYLNYSDRPAGRITGMTRFATFWVEGGEIVAPVPVMRFDESLLRVLGDQLVGLTTDAADLPDTGTYGGRALSGARAPGLLAEGFSFTL
ncbi:MAG: metallopeptidase TldD-related protein [Pseudomonadota bacterium]|nr:metallopeptidase TldD-related protein [Pseudomonadota bacterium]